MSLLESPMEESPQVIIQQEDALKKSLDVPDCSYSHDSMGAGHRQERPSVQRDDALYKAAWSKEMGDVTEGLTYRTVSVLLISWDDKAGDLKTGKEVQMQEIVTRKRLSNQIGRSRNYTTF